jgi:hypothetical protein
MPDPSHCRGEQNKNRDDETDAARHFQIARLIDQVHSLGDQVNRAANHEH